MDTDKLQGLMYNFAYDLGKDQLYIFSTAMLMLAHDVKKMTDGEIIVHFDIIVRELTSDAKSKHREYIELIRKEWA